MNIPAKEEPSFSAKRTPTVASSCSEGRKSSKREKSTATDWFSARIVVGPYGGPEHFASSKRSARSRRPTSVPFTPGWDLVGMVDHSLADVDRSVKIAPGRRISIHASAGWVRSAQLQLGTLARLDMYGTRSPTRAAAVSEMGDIPIDFRHVDFVGAQQNQASGRAALPSR